MKKGLIALIVLVILIGAGIGAEYYASTQITYDVNNRPWLDFGFFRTKRAVWSRIAS